MSPKVPKAYLDARRNEIIEAASRTFMEKGFHNTTMQDIYNATNLSPGAVYNYFRSKEDIVTAATEISQQRNSEMITAAASGDKDQALSNLRHALLSFAKQIDLAKAASLDCELYAEASRNPRIAEALRKSQDAAIAQLFDLVKYHQNKGIFNNQLDPTAIAQVLVSMFVGFGIQKILNPETDLNSYMAVYDAIISGTFSKEIDYREQI